ncbi:MAG: AAA family ATPase [Hydrogenothermaceae bacterium]|nr:AAA family ATPase [Hydrogenothermaceae bacterium]
MITKEIKIGGNSNFDIFSLHIGIDPIPVEFKSKIVMIGDNLVYELLSEYDPEFSRIFKIKAEFNPVKVVKEEDIQKFPMFIKKN